MEIAISMTIPLPAECASAPQSAGGCEPLPLGGTWAKSKAPERRERAPEIRS